MMRFTSRDIVLGEQIEPMTLHQYLYCWNSPLKFTDPSGEYGIGDTIMAGYEWHAAAIYVAATGVETGDWGLIMFGAFMETLIEPVMALAMISSRNSDYSDGGACFTEGTIILTPQGQIPIENIRPRQYVWAVDPDTGEPGVFEVVQCYKRYTDELVFITIGGETIETTREHPFYVYEKGWYQADELHNGTKLIDNEGNPIKVEKVEIKSCQSSVYNFEVAISHTYYVSKSKLLVHNGCGRKIGNRRPKSELNKIRGAIDQLDEISKAQRNGPGIEDITKSEQRVKNMLKWLEGTGNSDMWYD